MKTTLRPVLFCAAMLLLTGAPALADTDIVRCANGLEIYTDEQSRASGAPQTCEEAAAQSQQNNSSGNSQATSNAAACEAIADSAHNHVGSAQTLYSRAAQTCSEKNPSFARVLNKRADVEKRLSGMKDVNQSSALVSSYQGEIEAAAVAAKAECGDAYIDCANKARMSAHTFTNDAEENACTNPEISTLITQLNEVERRCTALKQSADRIKQVADGAKAAAASAGQNVADTNAAAPGGNKDGGGTGDAKADPAPKAAPPGGDSSGTKVADNGSKEEDSEDDEDKDKKKKKKEAGGSDMASGLLGAAGSLIQGMMANQAASTTTPATITPTALPADHCMRPENINTTVCICRTGMNTPGCLAAANTNNPTQFSSLLPGSGGAQLTKDTTGNAETLNLGGGNSEMMIPPPGENATLNPGMGGYSGGGGMGGGGGNFTPDQPKGRGGSSLSADIYAGTRGGSGMFGSRGGGPGGGGSYEPRDIEDLPGYKLDTAGEKPNLNRFMPAGAGSLANVNSPARGISGMLLPEGMHPSDANIFEMVTKRYRSIEGSLYP